MFTLNIVWSVTVQRDIVFFSFLYKVITKKIGRYKSLGVDIINNTWCRYMLNIYKGDFSGWLDHLLNARTSLIPGLGKIPVLYLCLRGMLCNRSTAMRNLRALWHSPTWHNWKPMHSNKTECNTRINKKEYANDDHRLSKITKYTVDSK